MKTGDGSFHQCYSGQAIVDAEAQVIVAADLTDQAPDAEQLAPTLDQLDKNLATVGAELPDGATLSADAGYFSEHNIRITIGHGLDPHIATGRFKHAEPPPPSPRGPIPKDATPKQLMARKLETKNGHHVYTRRKTIVEPVFGQLTTTQDASQLLLRGKQAARAQWRFHCAIHNLLKLHRNGGLDSIKPKTDTDPGTPRPETIAPKPFPRSHQRIRTPTRPPPTPTTPDRPPRARYRPALLARPARVSPRLVASLRLVVGDSLPRHALSLVAPSVLLSRHLQMLLLRHRRPRATRVCLVRPAGCPARTLMIVLMSL